MINRTISVLFAPLRRVAVMGAFALLAVGCSGDVYDGQAGIYDEYRERLDTVSSYESIKKLNGELNTKIVAFVRSNSGDVAQFHKEAGRHKEGVKTLVKSESEYVKTYLNKVMNYVLQQQTDIYTGYAAKVNDASGYDELVKLNHALSSEISKLGSENNDEFKKATALKICQDKFAGLNKAGETYQKAYLAKVTPLIFDAEAAIYNKYLEKLSSANGYRQLKDVKLFLDKEILMFSNDNSMVQVASDAYLDEKKAVAKAKESFLSAYMEKVAMPLIEYQKELYSGTADMFATARNQAELKALKVDFVAVNRQFLADNEAELAYIADAIADGKLEYRREMEVVNSLFSALNE